MRDVGPEDRAENPERGIDLERDAKKPEAQHLLFQKNRRANAANATPAAMSIKPGPRESMMRPI